jgi:hypothetical protein
MAATANSFFNEFQPAKFCRATARRGGISICTTEDTILAKATSDDANSHIHHVALSLQTP